MTVKHSIIILCLAGCDIGPRVSDDLPPDVFVPPDVPSGFQYLLPAGSTVQSIGINPELINQIRINDGLVDAALTASGGVITRGTGKSAGATVRFWNFGPTAVDSGFAVVAPLYVIGRMDTVFTPIAEHPRLIDTIPGDIRYSALRRVINVPVTDKYKGELITSVDALGEALELGLVGDPVPDGTWVNIPVVLPAITLEVGLVAPLASQQVYGRGYLVDVFELGTSLGRQPLRFGSVPIGQSSSLQTGVATGTPPTLPTAVDAQPVFQFAIPTVTPTAFSYSPIANDVVVRLANGIAPAAITADLDLFRRNATGAITAHVVDTVSTFTITTTVNNLQLQFVEGSP
jgi:hypothetical protein